MKEYLPKGQHTFEARNGIRTYTFPPVQSLKILPVFVLVIQKLAVGFVA